MTTFNDWWSGWPKKVAKDQAGKAYKKALKYGVTHDDLIRYRDAYVSLCRDRNLDRVYIMHPGTFLSGRWKDDDIQARVLTLGPSQAPSLFKAKPTPPSWNGTASKLIAEIGEAYFQRWFSDTEFEPGPPPIIWAKRRFQADWIRNRDRIRIERILGVDEIRVEIRV